jgi:hypothetical protein
MVVQKDRLDENYLQRWAGEFKVTRKLDEVLSGKIKPKQT